MTEENQQRTAEWFQARLGKLTASRAEAAFSTYKTAAKKGQPTEVARKLILEIAFERTTGNRIESPMNFAMQWGVDHEQEARQAYIEKTGNLVTEVGFIDHPEINWMGASPDGLVGEDGLVEIKCPSEITHIERLLADEVPEQYKNQMLIQLLCTGRKWCDFVDYDPRNTMNPLFIKRFEPTAAELAEAEDKAIIFLSWVEETVNLLKEIADAKTEEVWTNVEKADEFLGEK